MKKLKIVLWLGLGLMLVFAVSLYLLFNSNHYQLSGEMQVKGLKKTVKIYRDKLGMPYIFAESLEDLIFAQGFVTAQDRLFQMQLTRFYAEGRLTEMVGEKAKATDIRMRTLGFARNAQKHLQLLDKETLAFLEAYTAGVNAFIQKNEDIPIEFKLAGIKPELWTAETSLTVMYYMGWGSSANLQTEVLSLILMEKIGVEKFKSIYPINTNIDSPSETLIDSIIFPSLEPQTQSSSNINVENLLAFTKNITLQWGSNNWAVDGSRSVSGKPILASDPHLDSRILPGVMHPIGLFLNDNSLQLVGVTVPGIPGVLIGRSQYISNGITNAYLDVQDLYIEKIDPNDKTHYLEGDSSIPFETYEESFKIKDESPVGFRTEKITVRKTRRGVVISALYPEFKNTHIITLRYAPFENMQPKLGLDVLLKAKNVTEAEKYLSQITFTSNNFIIADTEGNIAWYLVGRVPKRKAGTGRVPFQVLNSEDTWTGWIPFEEMPHRRQASQEGWLGNANHNSIPKDYPFYISNYFSPYYRYAALQKLMKSKQKFTVDDQWQFQRDEYNVVAAKLTPIFIKALAKDERTKPLAEELKKWDYQQDIHSVGASIFQNIYRILPRRIFQDELGQELALEMLGHWYFWQERVEQLILEGESPWFDDIQTKEEVETLEYLIQQSGIETQWELGNLFGEDMSRWEWGKIHTISYTNPIRREGWGKVWLGSEPLPMGGSGETLYRSLYDYNQPEEVVFSACLRMVSDMGDKEKVVAVINGGVAARTFHPFQKNQIDLYMKGTQNYWWLNRAKIEENADDVLLLNP